MAIGARRCSSSTITGSSRTTVREVVAGGGGFSGGGFTTIWVPGWAGGGGGGFWTVVVVVPGCCWTVVVCASAGSDRSAANTEMRVLAVTGASSGRRNPDVRPSKTARRRSAATGIRAGPPGLRSLGRPRLGLELHAVAEPGRMVALRLAIAEPGVGIHHGHVPVGARRVDRAEDC